MSFLYAPPLLLVERSEPNSICYRETSGDGSHYAKLKSKSIVTNQERGFGGPFGAGLTENLTRGAIGLLRLSGRVVFLSLPW